MNTQPELCPDCGTGHLRLDEYKEEIKHRGQTLEVKGLKCWICDTCGAEIIRKDQIRHGDKLIADARRAADGLLTGEEIVKLRKHLGLTQRQAAELFGGGINAFSKYERGDVIQSVAMDRLIRMVARFPFLLTSLARDAGMETHQEVRSDTYSHVSSLSINDPEFRSRTSTNPVIFVEDQKWRRSA